MLMAGGKCSGGYPSEAAEGSEGADGGASLPSEQPRPGKKTPFLFKEVT